MRETEKRFEEMEKYVDFAVKFGASNAWIIDPSCVVTASWIAEKCREGCPDYGTNLCCPPFAPVHTETRKRLDGFEKALLFSSGDIFAITRISRKCRDLMKRDGCKNAYAFGGGSCRLCETCTKEKCVFPDLALPSIEACGIDVFGTLEKLGINPGKNCFGLVLIA